MVTHQPFSRRNLLAAGAALTLGTATAGSASADPRLGASTIAARRKFFGSANVHARTGQVRSDRVILSWFGVTSFAMAIGGQVVLLDAWVPRGPYSDVVPTTPEELVDLRPSHVFIGHGHFDHAADAGLIAAESGAVVVGTAVHCAQIAKQTDTSIRTKVLPITAVGGQANFRFGPRIAVTAIGHPHSTAKAPTGDFPPLLLPPDLTPVLTNPPHLEDLLGFASHVPDKEGGNLLYRFQIGKFSLLWNDSAGPIREFPDAVERLRRLGRPTVHLGAIQGFGQYTNGLRDPIDYIRAARPHLFVPTHHDNWAPPISSPAAGYERPLRKALATLPAGSRPSLRFIADPADYIRPSRLTFVI
ncbi:hypothetical protein BJ980_000017 [Nocardioides daedukensis]|uniref:MBL fold metallo-hydrolase n=1 Tax=Nocardioides daedukensis TaxID=634462 RepID=A0A7Y9RXH0_9ACTN|nr:MBL fold metallo-hydrolase [Nocardioides daedukensis]NYG57094.1 hypothetical protein [Nocardioides daedukensis]